MTAVIDQAPFVWIVQNVDLLALRKRVGERDEPTTHDEKAEGDSKDYHVIKNNVVKKIIVHPE